MKIPKLTIQELTDGIVSFVNEDKSIQGHALKRQGERESHYTVIQLKEFNGPKVMHMVETETIGSFQITGQISFLFDDGVIILNCKGFEFWLDREELGAGNIYSPEVGDWLQIEIENYELYL